MIPRVYIAGPYTAPTRAERVINVARARRVARAVIAAGAYPVCPHIIGIEVEDLQDDWEWWMRVTSQDLETCHAVAVVHGWESSTGTRQEIEQATREDQPIFYADHNGDVPGLAEWVAAFEVEP